MAPHSSTLVWKIPWMGEPGALQSMGSLRVGHDWMSSLSLFTFMHWRRKWQPTPVLSSGKSHGQRSLVGYSPWGCKESDTTERPHFTSGLVFWYSRVLESAIPLQRFRAWSLVRNEAFHKWFVMALREIKTNTPKWETKEEPQINGSYKIRQIIIKIMEYTHIHISP